MPHTSNELVGQTLDQCRVDSQLGQGGMGIVYRGWHLGLDLEVAIKVLPENLSHNAEFIARFYREARQAAKLDHPGIVRVLNVGEFESLYFIVMQFIDGPNLRDVVKLRGPLSPEEATLYAAQCLAGLEYAHSRGVIHRDIKPENLMLTPDGTVKITDFGLARGASPEDSSLTKTGQVMGTPHFMPMEQWDGSEIDHRADVYSLGVTLYFLLSGKLPLTGTVPTMIVRQLALGEIVPLHAVVPGLDPQLECIVDRMTARERDKRYPTAGHALRDLANWRKAALPESGGMIPGTMMPAMLPPVMGTQARNAPGRSFAATTAPQATAGSAPGPTTAAPMMTMADTANLEDAGALSGVKGLDELADLPSHMKAEAADTIVTPDVQIASTSTQRRKKKKKKKAGSSAGPQPAPQPTPAPPSRQPMLAISLVMGGILLVVLGAAAVIAMRGKGASAQPDGGNNPVANANDTTPDPDVAGNTANATNSDNAHAAGNSNSGEQPSLPDDPTQPADPEWQDGPDGPEGPEGPDGLDDPDNDRPPPADDGSVESRHYLALQAHAVAFAEALMAQDAERVKRFLEPRQFKEHFMPGARPENAARVEDFIQRQMTMAADRLVAEAGKLEKVIPRSVKVRDFPLESNTWAAGDVSYDVLADDGKRTQYRVAWYWLADIDSPAHGRWYIRVGLGGRGNGRIRPGSGPDRRNPPDDRR